MDAECEVEDPLLVHFGPLPQSYKEDPLICRHWKIPSGVVLDKKYDSSTCDHCQKTGKRESMMFHSNTCKNEYCVKIVQYEPIARIERYLYIDQLHGESKEFTRYCDCCYSLHYEDIGSFDLLKFSVNTSPLQNVISRIIKLPGGKTKSANKI